MIGSAFNKASSGRLFRCKTAVGPFCFRSPLYWSIGKLKGYKMSDRTAYGSERYAKISA